MPDTGRERRAVRPEWYPHIFDQILEGLPRETLLAVRPLSRYLRDRADVLLSRDVSVIVRPGDTGLSTCLYATDGRLPRFYKYHRAKGKNASWDNEGCVDEEDFSVFRETRFLSVDIVDHAVGTAVAEDDGAITVSTFTLGEGFTTGLVRLMDSAPLEVVRTREAGNTRCPSLLELVHLPPSCRTWSHFARLMSRTSGSIPVPPNITKLVLNLDLRVTDERTSESDDLDSDTPPPPRLFSPPWGNGYVRIVFPTDGTALALQRVVVRFYCSGTLPESLQHPPLRGPVRSVSMRMDVLEQIYALAKHVLAQPYMPGREGARTFFTIVDFPDPKVVHPRYLGIPLSATINTHETVESMFKGILNSILRRPLPLPHGVSAPYQLTDEQVEECLECVEFIDSETYARRVGEETFRLETEFGIGQRVR